MAWVYPQEYVREKVALDWRDVMANANEYAREWNGFWDRDNLREDILTKDDLQTRTFNALDIVSWNGTTTYPEGTGGGWREVDDLTTEITAEDGAVVVETFLQFTSAQSTWGLGSENVEMRLLVDLVPVASTGWNNRARRKNGLWLCGSAPVGAGLRRLSVEIRLYTWFVTADDFVDGTFSNSNFGLADYTGTVSVGPTAVAHTIGPGALILRHLKR